MEEETLVLIDFSWICEYHVTATTERTIRIEMVRRISTNEKPDMTGFIGSKLENNGVT